MFEIVGQIVVYSAAVVGGLYALFAACAIIDITFGFFEYYRWATAEDAIKRPLEKSE